jgi:carbamate kinase
MLTNVPGVYSNWGTPVERPVRWTTPATAAHLRLAPHSIGQKFAAACEFVDGGGDLAGIGLIEDAPAMLRGEAGTVVVSETPIDADTELADWTEIWPEVDTDTNDASPWFG